MKLFGYDFNRKQQEPVQQAEKAADFSASRVSVSLDVEKPVAFKRQQDPWVRYGFNNLYPEYLLSKLDTSGIHDAIITKKTMMVKGKGFLVNGIPFEDYEKANPQDPLVTMFTTKEMDINTFMERWIYDWLVYGAISARINWAKDSIGKGISKVKYNFVGNVRCGEADQDEFVRTYYTAKSWKDNEVQRFPPKKWDCFDQSLAQSPDAMIRNHQCEQLYYERRYKSGRTYYGSPDYESALAWISAEANLGVFHNANLENGFVPGMNVEIFEPTNNETLRQKIKGYYTRSTGPKNAGDIIVSFYGDKDNRTIITPIKTPGVDKGLIAMCDMTDQKIISAHGVTTPELLGLTLQDKMFKIDIGPSYAIFFHETILPLQLKITKYMEDLAKINGFTGKLTIVEFNPLGQVLTSSESKAIAEAPNQAPLSPAAPAPKPAPAAGTPDEAQN